MTKNESKPHPYVPSGFFMRHVEPDHDSPSYPSALSAIASTKPAKLGAQRGDDLCRLRG